MKTPDFTPEGIAALILGALTNGIVLLGLDLSAAQEGAITGLITTGVLVDGERLPVRRPPPTLGQHGGLEGWQ